jgi:hypothetical protein
MKKLSIVAITAFAFLALANFAFAQDRQDDKFQVSSTTFKNNSILPHWSRRESVGISWQAQASPASTRPAPSGAAAQS